MGHIKRHPLVDCSSLVNYPLLTVIATETFAQRFRHRFHQALIGLSPIVRGFVGDSVQCSKLMSLTSSSLVEPAVAGTERLDEGHDERNIRCDYRIVDFGLHPCHELGKI
jgi:hypothetical protein